MAHSLLTSFLIFCVSFLMFVQVSFATNPAEIININYKYKIAFSDLTENDVRPGELVSVAMPDGQKVHLKVLEVYPAMTKLTIPDDAANALSNEQFSAITIGSQVTIEGKPAVRAVSSKTKKPLPGAVSSTPEPKEMPALPPVPVPADHQAVDTAAHVAVLETRVEQLMANNLKLTDFITTLLAERNAVEARTQEKESFAAEVNQTASALSTENTALKSRILALGSKINALEQDKAAQQKEIESLNAKLVELKKKLAKMVEIINNNMKAYEKQ